tara:strand:- start:3312 stop:4631 length:1320 start_codon:yes stop_codon:yes gene_type:complete
MGKTYIEPVIGIESLSDSLQKNAAMLSATATVPPIALDAAKNNFANKKKEAEAAETKMNEEEAKLAEEEAKQTQTPKAHDIRQDASIESTKSGYSGSELPENAPLPPSDTITNSIDRMWFVDNFGMTGRELTEILIKASDLKTLDAIYPLLKLEKEAILDNFKGVNSSLVDVLPLTDLDYDSLNKNSERLDLPFRRFVKTWTSSDTEGKGKAESLWRNTLDKSERLSNREKNILIKCRDILVERGALNAQTLKSYNIQASTAEISSLIKSHGFLYDIMALGQFTKSYGRGLFYDVKRNDVLLKNVDSFLAGLIDNNSVFSIDARYNPRIELSFYAPTAPWYADALKKELDVNNIYAKGIGLEIVGDDAVLKTLEMASPLISKKSSEAFKMMKALRGDKNALIVMAYEGMNEKNQMALLKKHNLTDEEFIKIREDVLING